MTKEQILDALMPIRWIRRAKFRRERQLLLDLAFNALSHGDIVAVMNYKSKIDSLTESVEKSDKPK